MATLDELIAQHLQQSLASGELRGTPGWGQPLDFGDGYEQTPGELRMPFKILRDAGFAPPEVAWMKRAGQLRDEIAATTDDARADALRRELAEVQQRIALRLEKLRASGTL
jgi:hypothetical protein